MNRLSTLLCLVALVMAQSVVAEEVEERSVWTLYRTSVVDPAYVFHVATFDAGEGEHYNRGNCFIARDLFQEQPGVKVRYWCQPGWATDAQGRKD